MNCPECGHNMYPENYNCQTCRTTDFVKWKCYNCQATRTELRTCKHLREG